MRKVHVFSVLLALAAVAMLAGPALADVTPVGSLLFEDTFNTSATGSNVFNANYDINSSTRVFGPLAGQVSYDQTNAKALLAVDGPNKEFQLTGTSVDYSTIGRVALTKDFNGALALGGLTVSVKVNPVLGYAGIGVGHNGSAYSYIADLLNGTTPISAAPGFYGNVFNAGIFSVSTGVFAGDNTGNQWYSHFTTTSGYADFVDLTMVFTDATDNNPFNGSGTITANVYVGGTLIETATGPDFAHNYISLQAAAAGGVCLYQDLRIYGNAAAAPEPGTLALLAAAAGFACVWFRRRR
jgi:hypothetical protein